MCRLKMLKKEARKSMAPFSPKRRVLFPKVKSSFRLPKVRAPQRDLGSLPKVRGAGTLNAAGFQKGVVMGLKLALLVSLTAGMTLTRAIPVRWHPANKTSPAVPPHEP